MTDFDANRLLGKLQKLTENRLRDRIIVPLLSKYDFSSIEVRHGGFEKGIDILCIKGDELGELDLLAIQVKKLRFSGNVSERGHLHGVLNQLSQCLQEPIKLKDGTARLANRIWLISPYPLTISSLESSFTRLFAATANRIRIVDGPKLLSSLQVKAPELLTELGDRTTLYLQRLQNDLLLINEASAFRLREKISLLPLYVHLDLSVIPSLLFRILNGQRGAIGLSRFPAAIKEVQPWLAFGKQVEKLLRCNPIKILGPPRGREETQVHSRRRSKTRLQAIIQVDGRAFLQSIIDTSKDKISRIKNQSQSPSDAAGPALSDFHLFLNDLQPISQHKFVSKLLTDRSKHRRSISEPGRFEIRIEQLLGSRLNIQVIGDAGSGKTTLLRMIGNRVAAEKKDKIPVFVPLSGMTTRHSILGLIEHECGQFGLSVSRTSLTNLLESGRLLLLLDGIDEVSARVTGVADEIVRFMSTFRSAQVIVTTRPWAALKRRQEFFTVRLLPFTKDQVKLFFKRWFHDHLNDAEGLIDHLDRNPHLYGIVSTPLVATIFAVVKSFGGSLPMSLHEVYEERLRLLLHDWDAARGIKRDMFPVSDKRFFLRKFAYELHCKAIRTVPWDNIVNMVRSDLGEIRNHTEAERFVHELVQHNNVLFQESNGTWGLGHLQYQEYLAALEAKENPTRRLAEFLGDGWWYNPIMMYAQMTRDISKLICDTIQTRRLRKNVTFLHSLLQLAPNTKDKARAYVEKEWDILEAEKTVDAAEGYHSRLDIEFPDTYGPLQAEFPQFI